jgi:predicted nucleotidyltransferase/DNA-binding XRE family transcriptional regulator
MNSVGAGTLIRDARRRAGLSQVELGRRAGVTQSVVSAYESGARQPSLPTLERLVRAAGYALEISVRGSGRRALAVDQPVARKLLRNRRQVKDITARHGLSNVRVFGSVARGEDTAQSDVDLLVDVAPGIGLIGLARCERELEALLGVAVDLVPTEGLKPGLAASVLREARAL